MQKILRGSEKAHFNILKDKIKFQVFYIQLVTLKSSKFPFVSTHRKVNNAEENILK